MADERAARFALAGENFSVLSLVNGAADGFPRILAVELRNRTPCECD
jgi:hypothetical protein